MGVLAAVAAGVFLISELAPEPGSGSALQSARASVRVGERGIFSVDVADTPILRARGLSGRECLAPTDGMWFVFPDEGIHGFWMKDMHFPIDILWISDDFRVVHIEEHAAPESYPHVFYPDAPARYVLEIPAGSSARAGIVRGDRAELSVSATRP